MSLYSVLQIFRLRLLQRKSLSNQILRGLYCVKQSISDVFAKKSLKNHIYVGKVSRKRKKRVKEKRKNEEREAFYSSLQMDFGKHAQKPVHHIKAVISG